MKTFMTRYLSLLILLALGLTARAADEPQPAPDTNDVTEASDTNAEAQQQAVSALIQAVVDAQQGATNGDQTADGANLKPGDARANRPLRGQGARGTMGSGTNAISLTALVAQQATNHNGSAAKSLRLNFRNAPLNLVLDYLSDAAGFTISANSKVDLKGAVTVWSNQPVNRDEAVQLLHKALGEHNYAATVEGNVLNIYVVDASNTEILAGVENNDYTKVPPTKELVTQIVYVHNVESGQLITSLQPLMPAGTSLSANQGANAIVITDTKANIRRMVQLVKALDTASVSAAKVTVFPLTYADATALAQVVQQLFQTDSSSQSGRSRGGFPFGGGGFPFGGDRGGDRGGNNSSQQGRMSASKVVAVADDRSNSLVVSASDEQMALVENLVTQMDVNVDDVTELRVFRLRYADPQETADQLASLFPDPTTQQSSSGRSGFRGFGFFGGGFSRGGTGSTSTDPNSRKLRQTRVTAVPDPRTGSVIVSAAHDLMTQIGSIVEELDSDPAKKKKVYVIKVENRDPQELVEDLQAVISTDTSGGNTSTRNSQQSGSQLNTRQQNNTRNQGTTTSGFGTTSGSRRTGQ